MSKKSLFVIGTIAVLGLLLSFSNQALFARGGGGGGHGGGGEHRGAEARGVEGHRNDEAARRALQRTPALSRAAIGFGAGEAAASRNEGYGGGGGGTGVNIIQEPAAPQQSGN